jgi:hypothetical protein
MKSDILGVSDFGARRETARAIDASLSSRCES